MIDTKASLKAQIRRIRGELEKERRAHGEERARRLEAEQALDRVLRYAEGLTS